MGIYISGVKGLPEQVQENKNKIKEVEEQIEGIDFEAVRELQGQVAENTQDINNLEASIGVQNQAINTLNNDVDALESKTQKITYNEQSGELTIDSNVNIKRINITASQTPLRADSMVSQDDKNAISLVGPNDEISLIVGRLGTQHVLNFNADGTLDIDGNPIGGGGGATLYQHNITLIPAGLTGSVHIFITTERSTAFELLDIYNLLNNNGFTSNSRMYPLNDYINIDLINSSFEKVLGLYATNNVLYARINNGTTSNYSCTLSSDKILPVA